ncbi:MAG: NADH-quinone oxidoreductase subunit A [Candidatus Micrarchaeaceae archaeon]
MSSNYIAIGVFIILSLMIPSSLVLTSIFLGRKREENKVSKANFESAEASLGSKTSIMKEYFHYFTGFLAFEVLTGLILAWAYVVRGINYFSNINFIILIIFAMFFELFIMLFSLKRFSGLDE